MGYPSGIKFPFRFAASGGVQKAELGGKVLSNLKALVLSAKGERLIRKHVGSIGYKQVIKNLTLATAPVISALLREVITEFEPNAKILDVEVYKEELQEGTSTRCKISFIFSSTGEVVDDDFSLE